MKIFKLMAIALVAMVGLNSCSKDCDHEFIDVDHSADLVGTWTCHTAGYAEALVINADGSVLSTGVENGEFWDGVKGNIKTVNNKMTLTFEGGDNYEGRFEMICGEAFTIFDVNGEHLTYRYCENDLSDEIVGMWFWHGGENATIQTFTEDGKLITTSAASGLHDNLKQQVSEYKVVGDLRFHIFLEETIDHDRCVPARLIYTPNGTTVGDVMSINFYATTTGDFVETTKSFIRVKEGLNLTGQKYAYSSAYVTNAKGTSEDFTILGNSFNISNIKGSDFDVVFGKDLYTLEVNANSIKHTFHPNGQEFEIITPITKDGNKVTLDMSAVNPACRKVEMYMFQDSDDSQLHIFMPTHAFVNYVVNLAFPSLIENGQLDPTDAATVEKLYADMEAHIESINVSFVFKVRK